MAQNFHKVQNIIGIDVGTVRIGVALANTIAKIPSPLDIVDANNEPLDKIAQHILNNNVGLIVVGLPRDVHGGETDQSTVSRQFAESLQNHVKLPVVLADESLTSLKAQNQLKYRTTSSKHKYYDDVSACYILEEYFGQNYEI